MAIPGIKYSFIPKENKRLIYKYLMNEGVLVVQKNNDVMIHPQLNIPNLHVLMTMKSLKSLNYVEESFNWQHQYFTLTNEGIEYLRTSLHLPPTVFPVTLSKKQPARAGLASA
ncbi:small subunit ribosomal protein S10e [Babesia microti strain RI]|uniref:Small subunit ribosomal protein S10e n=1 Tax=Babesia microti (strain RI) TaxID=1133968 RepID=I7IHB3_BABMR|nr:small subunit ribosomal protein S10e [Babesia microti strain RI]CCF75512.1 small subunit ribosomal protein S10e [Babesia microti strain RI]|eukprot:XP_012649920.1 small subunit ribosomal protein S10e [Babesia microti strain RI]